MASKREVIIWSIVGAFFMVGLLLFALMFIGLMADSGGDYDFAGFGDKVGIIECSGILTEVTGRPIIKQLDSWAENGSIKAIVIHVNSPGGGVAISQEIFDAIKRAREEKPVVASMSSVAASGGYYVACICDRIVANPGTLTGSIGVIMEFHTAKDLLDKIGIGTETIKSGQLKDVGSYSRDMTESDELMLSSVVMDSYEQFVEAIAEGRGKDMEEIYPLADGSIFTGRQAYGYGLVDTLGGLTEAVEIAAELAGIEGSPGVVRPYKERRVSIFDLLGSIFGEVVQSVDNRISGPQLMYLYH